MSKEAKPDAWMPLYIGDWDGDTGHLDCEQDGAYGRLIRYYWRNGPLPDDDASLARIVRMDLKRWKRTRPVLAAFFKLGDGVWRSKRADAEILKWSQKKEIAAAKARAAAAKRWGSDATSNPQALREHSPSSSSTEVGGPKRPPTLSGQIKFLGPKEFRQALVIEMTEDWVASYIDPGTWQDVPERVFIPHNGIAAQRISGEKRALAIFAEHGVALQKRAA